MNVINFNAVVQSSRSHMMYTTKVIVEQRAPANRKYIFPYTCNTTLIDKVECIDIPAAQHGRITEDDHGNTATLPPFHHLL